MDLGSEQRNMVIFVIYAFLIFEATSRHVSKDALQKEECNLLVDIVFMIDGHSSITNVNFAKQKSFVKYIISHHNAPPGTVQVGFVVCSDEKAFTTEFQSSTPNVMRSLEAIQRPSIISDNNNTIHCIEGVEKLFNESKITREKSTKIAMLLVGDDRPWTSEEILQKSTNFQLSGVSVIVISIGNKSFEQLHALETISTMDTFLVLKSYDELNPLSEHFSKTTCLPLSLDLDPTKLARVEITSTSSTTTVLPTQIECAVIENSVDFDFKVKIPLFGWVNRKKCLPGTKFDLSRCECIIKSIIRIENNTTQSII